MRRAARRRRAQGILGARRLVVGASVAPVSSVAPAATDGAKQLAAERGVELAKVKGTGQGGTIIAGDIKRYLKSRER